MRFHIVAGPMYSPVQLALAPRYSTVESAIADMGLGMVVASDGRLVAFHERHLPMVERMAVRST